MAAGTDITHPVSALEGVYNPQALESLPVCTSKENGSALDSQEYACLEQNRNDRDGGVNKPPRPATVAEQPVSFHRRSSSIHIPSVSSCSQKVENRIQIENRIQVEGRLQFENRIQVEKRTQVEKRIPVENRIEPLPKESSTDYMPVIRSGGWMDIGVRASMEDTHLRIDDLVQHAGGLLLSGDSPGAFYGVFDGHGGKEAASFVREHLLTNILGDVAFPTSMDQALRNAFLQTDLALVDEEWASGTTALTAMVFGRDLVVANAGDCRAVLSKRGKAVNMSRDHKPGCLEEKIRIEAAGGFVSDGYLNGQLNVARALGDWRMIGVKEPGVEGPLSAEPEVKKATLTEEDEFLIIGCDGLWDVFTSQNAVDFARRKLQEHNDPERCSKELVAEALQRNTCDNLTVVTVCFQPNPPPKPPGWAPRFRRSISAEGLKSLQGFLNGEGGP